MSRLGQLLKAMDAKRFCYVCKDSVLPNGKPYTWDLQSRYVHLLCVPGANGDEDTGYRLASGLATHEAAQPKA